MAQWHECAPGAGVYRAAYDAASFGEATALAIWLEEGGWAVLSPPPEPGEDLHEPLLRRGPVRALILPNIAHRSGVADWLAAHPGASLYAGASHAEALSGLVKHSVHPIADSPLGEGVRIREAPGTRTGSIFMEVRRAGRSVVYLDEVVITMTARPRGWLTRVLFALTGTRPGLGLNKLFLRALCEDSKAHLAAAAELCAQADIVCVAHGPPLSGADLDAARRLLAGAV